MYELKKGNGQKPLWSQLYDVLLERIKDHVYEEGGVLPSEAEIMKEFSVSRITVRQAMDRLLQEGFILRRRGSGTVVLRGGGQISTSFRSSFRGEEHNHLKDRRTLSVSYETVPPETAGFFGTSVNQPLLSIVRASYLNNRPVVYYRTWISPACMVNDMDDFSGSLYELLEQAGHPIDRIREVITASISTEEEKNMFGLEQDMALVRRIRMGFSKNRPIEYTDSLYLSEDYELTIDEAFTGNR